MAANIASVFIRLLQSSPVDQVVGARPLRSISIIPVHIVVTFARVSSRNKILIWRIIHVGQVLHADFIALLPVPLSGGRSRR